MSVGLREGAGIDSEVVGEKWVMLWGDREGQGRVGAGQEQARSQRKLVRRCSAGVLCTLWDTQAM